MAGKPEQQPASYLAPPNQNEQQLLQAAQSQIIQENSVLVYVSGDSLAYAGPISQNAGQLYQHRDQHHPYVKNLLSQQQQQQQQQQAQFLKGAEYGEEQPSSVLGEEEEEPFYGQVTELAKSRGADASSPSQDCPISSSSHDRFDKSCQPNGLSFGTPLTTKVDEEEDDEEDDDEEDDDEDEEDDEEKRSFNPGDAYKTFSDPGYGTGDDKSNQMAQRFDEKQSEQPFVMAGRSCDSARSDTAESSCSSLDSPENNAQDPNSQGPMLYGPASVAYAQQAARPTAPRNIAPQQPSSATRHRLQPVRTQNSVSVPLGWKRICTNGVIIYISPSSTALGSLEQLKEYLTTAGTCKCGLECPLRPEKVFNFDPKVATRTWSPNQGKSREMTKLCNHKRKLVIPLTGVNLIGPTVVSSSTASAGQASRIPETHTNADLPSSSDKNKPDGLSKKKKRKLTGVGGLYSGVSVSQILAQRERASNNPALENPTTPNGSQVWPVTIPNLQIQQNNQQINHQPLNSPSQNHDLNRNLQTRLNPHNGMTGMLMGNPLIMNQQGSNFVQQDQFILQPEQQMQQQQNLMQQHISQDQSQQHMQLMQLQHEDQVQQHQRILTNQVQQQQTHYVNQLNQHSLHLHQQQQQQQQLHLHSMQKHNVVQQQQHAAQEMDPQNSFAANYSSHGEQFVHNVHQNSNHQQMHQMHQQQQQGQHIIRNQVQQDPFQMHLQYQQKSPSQQQQQDQMQQHCSNVQYPNGQMLNHHGMEAMSQQANEVMNGLNETQMRHNRQGMMNVEEMNVKQMQQQQQHQLLMHNQNMQRHHIIQNGIAENNHENVQRLYGQHQQVPYAVRTFEHKAPTVDPKHAQMQYPMVNQMGRNSNSSHTNETQSCMPANGQSNNIHFNPRAPPWQQNRNNQAALHQQQQQQQQVMSSVQNINTFDRVPPLHQHIPQAPVWQDEVARKKAKSGKIIAKKHQRQQHAVEPNPVMQNSVEEFVEKTTSANQIGSTVNNNGPSFLDDPSGYLAQQTALLNSTISRQTGVTSSQVAMMDSSKASYLPQPKPSSVASPTSTTVYNNSMKNHPTSPVVVHSSMTPTPVNNPSDGDASCQRCISTSDKHQMQRHYLLQNEQQEDISSTLGGDKFPSSTQRHQQQQIDSRPIQGGTISTSHGSPVGTNSPGSSDTPTSAGLSQPPTPQNFVPSQPSTPSYSQPSTPHSVHVTTQSQVQNPFQSPLYEQRSATPCAVTSTSNDSSRPSVSPLQSSPTEVSSQSSKKVRHIEGYQPHPHAINATRVQILPNFNGTSSVITTMASGHTVSSNTITSVLAGRANTATVSVNAPNPALPSLLAKPQQATSVVATSNSTTVSVSPTSVSNVSKSPLEMVQSVVSSIQVPQVSNASTNQQQAHLQQSNVHVHNVLTSAANILKQTSGSSLPAGHILVSSGGQLIMASTGSNINGVMAPPPPKIITNTSSMPPLSVSPMVTNVTAAVSQVIPAVGVAQQVIGQPTVLVNTIQTPVLIQPGVMTMDGTISQNMQIPHLTVATGNVIQNAQSIIDTNQEVARNVTTNNSIVNRQAALLSPESAINKKKAYKKRKNNSQTVASMLHISSSSQQNAGVLMQSQSNFAQQNFQTQSISGPMLQALTIVPGKGGAPAQLVMNGQAGAASAQFNAQQIIANPQPTQQINLLQPVNLLNGTTGMVQNFPTIQQFIVPGLGSMVMSADGTATLLQDTGNIGMQLQIQNVNGQNVLTPVQSHNHGIFSPTQGSILAAGPAGMVIRAPQATGGKIIQQHSPGTAQFLSPNSGQFLVNGTASFGNQLSPIVANVSPNQQVTFNTTQVRPSNIQAQQEFIQMNGQTLMVPCATTQNIAVSSAPNQQNTTFVQQNTTIVQQQTTMVSNNQIPNFQTTNSNTTAGIEPAVSLDHNQSYILNASIIQGKSPTSPKSGANSPSSEQIIEQQQQQQFVLASSSTTVVEKTAQQCPLMARHSVSTQTAANQNIAQSQLMRQGSPPDTTTHSPGNSQRSNSPAVDTTTHGAASPAPPLNRHSSSTPMVHCISSSEPDTGDPQLVGLETDWRMTQGTVTKEMTVNHLDGLLHGKTFVESTVTTGIQIYTKQAEGAVSTVRCEGREHTLGRGIKRKLDSIHAMHSTLHEDHDASNEKEVNALKEKPRKVQVGDVIWGAARGSTAWPGKIESLGEPGSLTAWVRWYGPGSGANANNNLSLVDVGNLKSLSEGLEAHHRARKKFRKSRKLNMQLENAIQEAMAELDKVDDSSKMQQPRKDARSKSSKSVLATLAAATVTISKNGRSETKRTSKKNTESR